MKASCDQCAKPFEPRRKGHRYCSPPCRAKAHRSRARDGAPLPPIRQLSDASAGGFRPVSVDTLIAPAVSETISQLEAKLQPEDAALARLAQRYAATIDDARQIANALNNVDQTEDNARLLYALWARVEAQTVLDTLGPKLLAALEQLGATPKARASAKGGAGRGGSGGRLAALREAR